MIFTKFYVVKLGITPNVTLFVMYNYKSEYTTKTSQCTILGNESVKPKKIQIF